MRIIPKALKQAINRATLPVRGMLRTSFATPYPNEMVNLGGFDEGAEAIEDAEEAFTLVDREVFGPGEKWAPWYAYIHMDPEERGRPLITVTRDEESEKAREITVLVVHRESFKLSVTAPAPRWWNRLAVTFLRVIFNREFWR